MKQAFIHREPCTDQGTFGCIAFGPYILRCVELPWRENRVGHSCIPPGTYQCEMTNSPTKGLVYEVKDVSGRSHVLIHSANFAGDVDLGWTSELEGCIAPAMSVDLLENHEGKQQRAGLHSRPALEMLMGWANGEPFELVIS